VFRVKKISAPTWGEAQVVAKIYFSENLVSKKNNAHFTKCYYLSMTLASDSLSYTDLYTRWEHGNWSAMDLDFTEDKRQWNEEMTAFERQAALWNYALFFWGEDAVADNLTAYIDAAPLIEQKYFLTTQQVDEARHAVFFKRFMEEVCGIGNGTVQSGLETIQPQLTPGFNKIFERLDKMSAELKKTKSFEIIPKLAQAVTLYHIIVEATLAQPGQHMICSYLEERELLPAFRKGMENISSDEQRHIGFGVKILSDLNRQDDRVPQYVAAILRELLPYTAQVLMPPGWDERYLTVFGYSYDKIGVEGMTSLQTKLRSAGLAIESLPGPPLLVPGLSPLELSRLGRSLAQKGITGVREHPTQRDEETVALLFETIKNQAQVSELTRPVVFQWDFTDSDISSWQMRISAAGVEVTPGTGFADLTFIISYQDWVDIIGNRLSPLQALLKRKLKLKGDLRHLVLFRQTFM